METKGEFGGWGRKASLFCLLSLAGPAWLRAASPQDNPSREASSLPAVTVVAPAAAFPDYGIGPEGSTLSSSQLKDLQVDSALKLNGLAPNVVYQGGGARGFNAISGVRGLMNSLYFTDPTLVFYVDDVPYLVPYSVELEPDSIRQLSLLRGSQASRFGTNAPGGVVQIEQTQPTSVWAAKATSDYGSYDHAREFAEVSGPVSKELSFLASGLYDRRGGYLENTTRGTRPDSQEETEGRVALRWAPQRELTFDLNLQRGTTDDGVQRFTPLSGPPGQIASRTDGRSDSQSGLESLRVAYDADDYRVLFVSSHRSYSLGPNVVDMAFGRPSVPSEFDVDQDQYVQELRVSSTGEAEWKWSGGLSYQRLFVTPRAIQGVAPGIAEYSVQEGTYDSYALFGEVERKVSDAFSLRFGNRLQLDSRSASRSYTDAFGRMFPDRQTRQYAGMAPTLSGSYDLDGRNRLFASSGLAFRPGGYGPFASATTLQPYGEERTWENSVGWKTEAWEKKVSSTVTLFWNETYGYQLERYDFPVDNVVNVPEVSSRGVEWEGEYRPIPSLALQAQVGYTRATFADYRDGVSGRDYTGNRVPYVPTETGLVGATYRHPLGWMAHVDCRWFGKTDFDPADTPLYEQSAYALLAARVGYEAKHWSVYLYGENLTDTRYDTLIFPLVGAQVPGDPQTFGVRAEVSW